MRHMRRLMGLVVLIAAANPAQAATPGNSDIVQLGFRNTHRCVLHEDGAVDCDDAIDENLSDLQLHPEKTGLVFSTTLRM